MRFKVSVPGAGNDLRMGLLAAIVAGLMTSPLQATPITDGLMLWLDSNDLDGDGSSEGSSEAGVVDGKVATWVDKSSSDYDVTQGDAGLRPTFVTSGINGKPVVRFDGTADSGNLLENTNTTSLLKTGMTFFAVAQPFNSDKIYSLYSQGQGNTTTVTWAGTHTNQELIYQVNNTGASTELSTENAWTANQPFIFTITSSGTAAGDTFLYSNGTDVSGTQTATASPSTGPITIGSQHSRTDRFLNGYIAEILIYDRVLSPAELNDVGYYLEQSWDIQGIYVPEPALVLPVGLALAVAVLCRRLKTRRA